MIEIDIYHMIGDGNDDCALIVCAPTAILYTAQCGGMDCHHPQVEGFFLPLWDIAPGIDDHAMGCSDLNKTPGEWDKPDLREHLAAAIDAALAEPEMKKFSFKLRFDRSRIDELMEGWWPLRIKGTLHGVEGLDHPCYYHRGNCD
jgi:hypothetical protein